MKKIELKTRALLRKVFGGISLTAAFFVFQACYGPEPDPAKDIKLSFTVKSKTTNLPVTGIKVAIDNGLSCGFTDGNGELAFYTSVPNVVGYGDNVKYAPDSLKVHFLDPDGIENGLFVDKTVVVYPTHKDEIQIDVELEEK